LKQINEKNNNYNITYLLYVIERNNYRSTRTSRATDTAKTCCRRKIIFYFTHLLINSYGVQARVHDVYPAVSGRQHEQRHQRLAQIVKIVFLIDPCVFLVGQAFFFVAHVFDVRALAVKKRPFEKLYERDTKRSVCCFPKLTDFILIRIIIILYVLEMASASTDNTIIALS